MDVELVGEGDEATVEHPVDGAGESEAVGDAVGAVGLDRLDMGGFDLSSAVAVDQLQAGDRAAAVIGLEHALPESAVANDSGRVIADPLALEVGGEGGMIFCQEGRHDRRFERGAEAREERLLLGEAAQQDSVEIFDRNRADGGLGSAGDSAGLVEQAALDEAIGAGEGDVALEVEIGGRVDQREIHSGFAGVGDDVGHLRHGEIAAGGRASAGLVIEDPVADEAGGAAQIRAREMVAVRRVVAIAAVLPVQEHAPRHFSPPSGSRMRG